MNDHLHFDPSAPLPPLPGHSSGGRLERVLRQGRFAVTAELNPPDSADPRDVYDRALVLAERAASAEREAQIQKREAELAEREASLAAAQAAAAKPASKPAAPAYKPKPAVTTPVVSKHSPVPPGNQAPLLDRGDDIRRNT